MKHSYSAIRQYEGCPANFKYDRIDKLQVEQAAPAAERGVDIHSVLEQALLGKAPLTPELQNMAPKIETFKQMQATPERKVAINREWKPVDFHAEDVYIRGVIDVFAKQSTVATVVDWKSGKQRDYSGQVRFYSALVFAIEPEVATVQPVIEFTDLGKTVPYSKIRREEFDMMRHEIDERIATLESDKIFAPNPSTGCKWCPFGKSKGSVCKWG